MAKYYGKVGYATSVEVRPGVYKDEFTERNYSGDLVKNANYHSGSSNSTIDDLNVSNRISILADPYANENCHSMKYAEFMGAKWKITNVEVQYPRIILTLGGVYNGK